ncbi:hypothetical protein [Elizabethkingia miricola]|uniref:hypothetical protein n=1 Tax=Elizabethkingia miricola TaxID=172045 RepID=UPI0013748CEC|nr:hypothetical protein [Elizabethkingia miricola]QHQ86219.1 hypothetical protein FE632_05260 [Elizabethkingia miricola]UIO97479.1 hypothetical protein LYZ41_05170 [Elizabethkingia miricola]WER14257.1 hypothetical protein P0M31_05155 [Elizabethkingia miricola]WGL74430.1 hypothetical protein QFB80_05120 [Elizabethkingia miricola]WNG66187.1 hypothetical protein M9H57_05275 [Elizabethkingia miricola]
MEGYDRNIAGCNSYHVRNLTIAAVLFADRCPCSSVIYDQNIARCSSYHVRNLSITAVLFAKRHSCSSVISWRAMIGTLPDVTALMSGTLL